MELQVTIFFALTFLVLAGNAAVLWAIRQALHRSWARVHRRRAEYGHIGTTLGRSLQAAEGLTARLAAVSGKLRSSVETLDDGLERTENLARYGLAKADFNADRVSLKLLSATRRVGRELHPPLYRTATVIHGARAILEQVSRWQGRTPGRIERTARVLGRLDTAAAVIQAVTAIGELYRKRRRDAVPPAWHGSDRSR